MNPNLNFDFDTTTGKYSVSGEGAEEYKGSDEDIDNNFFTGNLKVGGDKNKAMSVAMSILTKAQANPSTQATQPQKEKATLDSIDNETIRQFGTASNYERHLQEAKTDEDRKKLAYEVVTNQLNNYIKSSEENKDKFDFADVEKAKNLLNTVKTGDWDKVLDESAKSFQWDLTSFLLTPEQKAALEEKSKVDAERERATKAKATYDRLKIKPELQELLYQSGFTDASPT